MPMSFKSQLNHFGSAKSTTPLPNFRDKIESGYESMSTGNDVETISNVNTVTSMETHKRKDHGIVLDQCDEEVLIKVRENIETLIEGFIGSSLDQAHVNKPYIHDKYDQILDEYQTPLAQAILNLTEALFLSLQNQPFINGNIPTNAHSHLKKLILHLNHLAGQLPKLPVHLKSSSASSSSSSSENIELDESQSYEDLLAIAIINELIKTNQERNYYSTSTMMTGEASSSTSSNSSSRYGDNHRLNRNVTQSNGNSVEDNYFTLTTPSISSGKPSSMKCTKKVKGNEVNGNNLRDDDNNSGVIVEQTEPSDGCVIYHQEEIYPESSRLTSYKGGENEINVNIADIIKDRDTAYKIEEQIEEITTTTTAPDEEEDAVDSGGGSEGYKDSVDSEPERRRHVDCLLDPYGLDLTSKGCARVAFPELGLDIMDLAYLDRDDDEDDTNEKLLNGDNFESKLTNKVKVVDDFSWEENWLFQKKRKAENDVAPLYCLLNLSESTNPVCMLIPNPSQIVPPFIGLTAVDQLSDLTERNSVGSLEFSSDEESEIDETEAQSSSSYPLENIKCSSSAKLKVPLHSASSASSSPFPASSLSSSSSTLYNKTTIVNNKQKSTKCLNSAANHKSSSPLAPLKIPDFIPSNKRSSSLTCSQPFIANSSNNNQTSSTNGPITNANNDDPTFTLLPQSANVQSDILIQFCCRVKGSQPLGVAWYRKGQFIGGTIEKGRSNQFNIDQKDGFDQMSDGVETKDFKTFKHFTDHILEIKSTRVDLSGTYSACVYNHVNQHWIDFNVKIYPKTDYHHPYRFPRSTTKSFQKVISSPPPAKQRPSKSNSTSNGPKVLSETFHSHCKDNEVNNRYENSCNPDETSFAPKIASIVEQEQKKWEESTVAWPDNPYTTENVGKRKHLNQFLDSLDPSVVDSRNRIEDDEANLHALPYISPSKDMGRFKRDYYVPNVPKEHETCNGFDEKVYSSVKYFSSSESPGLNYSETDLKNSHEESTLPGKLLIPTVTTTAPTPTVSCSPSPSAISSSSSSSPGLPRIINEHHLQYKHAEAQVLENLGNITSLVSVKELINRFSALKESTNPMNGQYAKDSNNLYSLNRDGTLANSGTGIYPRLITDKHNFSVPFKLSCWLDDENGDNNGHDMYHDENDNINDNNLYSPRNKVNCHETNTKSQSIEQMKDFNNHDEKNNCHHEMLYHQQEPNQVNGEQCIDYYQRSNSEASLPTLMSPPPPILPPRPQPRLSTKSSQANSSQPKLHSTKPQHPLAVNSITGRCLNKEYRNWTNKNQSNPSSNLMGSLSLYDINQVSETSGKFQSSNPASPGVRSQSNAGYNSDDCNSSEQVDNTKNSTPFGGKKVVRRMAPSIMKRASFWEKRCEQEMST